jgi:hypothetical protein
MSYYPNGTEDLQVQALTSPGGSIQHSQEPAHYQHLTSKSQNLIGKSMLSNVSLMI